MSKVAFERGCPLCKSAAWSRTIGTKKGFEWARCGRCSIRYVDIKKNNDLHDYEDYYGEHSPVVPESVRERLSHVVRSFEPYRAQNRLLDVGFGAGWLLRAAAEQGWSCWGTELAAESLEAARSQDWQVVEGDLLAAGYPSDHFDVITLVEVLEHLADPLAYIEEAARLLRPGGLLYGTTPNAHSINARILRLGWSIYAPPEHLQLFTRRALKFATKAASLKLVQTRAEGLNPSELRTRGGPPAEGTSRVEAGYVLNERMERTRSTRMVKATANKILSWTQLGDSLKFYAVSP